MVQQAQEEVLHGDILVLHPRRRRFRGVQGLVHVRGDVDLPRLPASAVDLGKLVNLRLDGGSEAVRVRAHGGEKLGNQPLIVVQQGAEQMGLLDLLVPVGNGQFLGALDGGQRLLCQFVHIHQENLPCSAHTGLESRRASICLSLTFSITEKCEQGVINLCTI